MIQHHHHHHHHQHPNTDLHRLIVAGDHDIHSWVIFFGNPEVIQAELWSLDLHPYQEVGDEGSTHHDQGLRDDHGHTDPITRWLRAEAVPPPYQVEDLSHLSQHHPAPVMDGPPFGWIYGGIKVGAIFLDGYSI